MTHYDTLQVVPWAEDSVVRAAYRALMRVYHPDTNKDPEAQLRVREITAAFAVLGDPAKRAAYDVFPTLENEMDTPEPVSFAADRMPRWSMRSAGVVSVGAAVLVLSLTIAMWPQSGLRRVQRDPGNTVENTKTARIAPPLGSRLARDSVIIHLRGNPAVSGVPKRYSVLPETPTPEVASAPPSESAITKSKRNFTTASSKSNSRIPMQKTVAAEIINPKASVTQAPSVSSRTPAAASCPRESSKVGAGECADDRQAQVERIAAIFFRQSMEHADSHKQQLLLSARTRSASSRTLCRSSECVTQSYLRQMRDTTEIMQGRIPTAQ